MINTTDIADCIPDFIPIVIDNFWLFQNLWNFLCALVVLLSMNWLILALYNTPGLAVIFLIILACLILCDLYMTALYCLRVDIVSMTEKLKSDLKTHISFRMKMTHWKSFQAEHGRHKCQFPENQTTVEHALYSKTLKIRPFSDWANNMFFWEFRFLVNF